MKTEASPASILADLGTAQDRISSAQRQLEIARTSPAECIQTAGIRSALALLEGACNVLGGIVRERQEEHELQSCERADEIRAEG